MYEFNTACSNWYIIHNHYHPSTARRPVDALNILTREIRGAIWRRHVKVEECKPGARRLS